MRKWYLINVVYYDGCDAYVEKFIGKVAEEARGKYRPYVTEDTENIIEEYLKGNGEILKFDPLYPLTLDNIIAIANDGYNGNSENMAIVRRFEHTYFESVFEIKE